MSRTKYIPLFLGIFFCFSSANAQSCCGAPGRSKALVKYVEKQKEAKKGVEKNSRKNVEKSTDKDKKK